MDVYRQAADVIKAVRAGEGTAKALCLRKEMQKKKQTYAVVCETLRHYELLEDLLKTAAFFEYYPQASRDLSLCMAYDAVIGKGVNTKNDTTARAVADSVKYLRDAYAQVRRRHHIVPRSSESMDTSAFDEGEAGSTGKRARDGGDVDGEEEAMASGGVAAASLRLPRYARVNTLKIDAETLVQRLRSAAAEKRKQQQTVAKAGRILPDFTRDPVVPDLLVFPSGTDLHAHPAVRGGQLVLQDRASCLPPCVLLDAVPVTVHGPAAAAPRKPLEYVVDACAAPGNKTTQLAALGAPKIRIMALELDERRAGLLEHRVQVLGAGDYVNVNHLDFFQISSEHREATEGILLDPSCSASGVLSRVDIEVGGQAPSRRPPARAALARGEGGRRGG
ncbi:methyltransferase [Strigomonas culicis]|uniref:Methyltransferase n=1 Tax=Strigomonas culicis TaxID=28005 RepID=S9U259_9TRYP|nr:methyltransferase [Strigomonas culicis]|eukprot:EPY22919.1 methyltransferase [Strigomonas culicis]